MQQGIRPSRYDTPYEFSPLAERTILEPYGKIETLKRTVFRDYPNIFDGKVIVSFTELYTDRLPDVFQLKGGQIIVREAGQPVRRVECTKCRVIDLDIGPTIKGMMFHHRPIL